MPRQVIGILLDGAGSPVANGGISFTADDNYPPSIVLGSRSLIQTSALGAYDVTLADGDYSVRAWRRQSVIIVGKINITDGAAISLPELLEQNQ